MLTNEQCIEVAKLWGWRLRQNPLGPSRYWVRNDGEVIRRNGNLIWDDETIQEINSWQGFGRTVEAMADRTHCAFYGRLKAHLAQYFMDESKEKLNGLFEMVHLAALEEK